MVDMLIQGKFQELGDNTQGPIECLSLIFENDAARRAYFTKQLRQHLSAQEFHQIEGFPIGDIKNILRHSDPPYFTACPNPFLEQILTEWQSRVADHSGGQDAYHREPFAADISEGKNHPLYSAFSYHTKVPPQAISTYIEHYCPDDGIVLDGFCGSGMVGVASRLSGRNAILADLSPAATAIAAAYCLPVHVGDLTQAIAALISQLDQECGWLYQVNTDQRLLPATIDYLIWSEQYRCSNCQSEFLFSTAGFNFDDKKPQEEIHCPACDALLANNDLERCLDHTGRTIEKPVRVKYLSRRRSAENSITDADLKLLETIEGQPVPYVFPDELMMHSPPNPDGWGDMWRRGYHSGVWRVTDFFYKRTLWVIAAALEYIEEVDALPSTRTVLRTSVINAAAGMTKMRRAYQGTLPLVLYMPRMRREVNAIRALETRLNRSAELLASLPAQSRVAITTQSSTHLANIPNDSIDYIFTDPPFGNNIIYSEVNFIWESLLQVFTNQKAEAIVSNQQHKGLLEYQSLMSACFREYYRTLKPGRWMTVEFHNSKNSIWNAIQDALQAAGFVVADVRILDKQQGSFKQVSTAGAVKQDLIISAYKPTERLEQQFQLQAGSESGAWEFVREHLRQLPVYVDKDGSLEVIAERQNHLLYDRMLAFHVRRQVTIPVSAHTFYAGLSQRFPERDGMYFLPEQVASYDQKRVTAASVTQLPLFVTDEASAIQWLRQELQSQPQTHQELHPKFTRELATWQKTEKMLELLDLLRENFLRYDGIGQIPVQIWGWLLGERAFTQATQEKNREQPTGEFIALAKDRWYVPDPNQAQDLEKLRERALLREFEQYRAFSGKILRVFRLEALRAGFKRAWQEKDYATILAVANKIPEDVLQEDPKLLMWYDQALTRSEK